MKVKKRLSHKDSSIGLRRTETAIFTPAACGSEARTLHACCTQYSQPF